MKLKQDAAMQTIKVKIRDLHCSTTLYNSRKFKRRITKQLNYIVMRTLTKLGLKPTQTLHENPI